MKKYSLVILTVLLHWSSRAQQPLTIGDKMPDWTFKPLVNGTQPLRLSQLKGKAVMICFWSSTCGGSLDMLPKAKELEQQFAGSFKSIFVVDDKDPSKPVALLQKRKTLKDLGITLMQRDTVLLKHFPHSGGPFVALMAPDGHIRAITSGTEVTGQRIAQLLKGEPLNVPLVTPHLRREEFTTLIEGNLLSRAATTYSSVLTGYIEKLGAGLQQRSIGSNRFQLLVANASLFDLYTTAYTSEISRPALSLRKRLVLNVKDKEPFQPHATDFNPADYFTYELVMPVVAGKKMERVLKEQMRQELDRYFNLHSAVERREVPCLLLKPKETTPREKESEERYTQAWNDHYELHKATPYAIANQLNQCWDKEMITCDESDTRVYSINLEKKYGTLEELKTDMNRKGFELVPFEKEFPFLVISDR